MRLPGCRKERGTHVGASRRMPSFSVSASAASLATLAIKQCLLNGQVPRQERLPPQSNGGKRGGNEAPFYRRGKAAPRKRRKSRGGNHGRLAIPAVVFSDFRVVMRDTVSPAITRGKSLS